MTRVQKENVSGAVYGAHKGSLTRRKHRDVFVQQLAKASGYWNSVELKKFVEEMRGLDFYNKEDRQLFLDFFFCWVVEQEN